MKTDRFDEEFRRKLLGLPADADPGEVERIHDFVRANKPALPSPGWGKLLFYGGSSLLLIGSLSYNLIQNYRATRLQSSIDSLAHRSVVPVTSGNLVRHDTVYITRNGRSNAIESYSLTQADRQELQRPTPPNPLDEDKGKEAVAIGDKEAPLFTDETSSSKPSSNSSGATLKVGRPSTDEVVAVPNQRRGKPDPLRNEGDEELTTLPSASPERSVSKNHPLTNYKKVRESRELDSGKTAGGSLLNNRVSATKRPDSYGRKLARQSSSTQERDALAVKTYSGKTNQRTDNVSPAPTGFTSANRENSALNNAGSERSTQTIAVQPITNRQVLTTSNQQLALIVPGRPLIVSRNVSSAKSTRQPWHLTLPTLSVPNAQYRIGVGVIGGIGDQLGGSLLGEIQLNRRWSVQAGLRLLYNEGFHYHDEQEFDEHETGDFRQTYASQVPSSSDIQDIGQHSLLVQLPLQVAYHYPLGRQWGLRLGVGTDLDLWVRSVVSYNYRENSRSSQKGLSLIDEPVYVLNNLTLSTMVERSWKKWQFRAGPFISPQLRPVGYKPDDLSWGANLQVLYRLGK